MLDWTRGSTIPIKSHEEMRILKFLEARSCENVKHTAIVTLIDAKRSPLLKGDTVYLFAKQYSVVRKSYLLQLAKKERTDE